MLTTDSRTCDKTTSAVCIAHCAVVACYSQSLHSLLLTLVRGGDVSVCCYGQQRLVYHVIPCVSGLTQRARHIAAVSSQHRPSRIEASSAGGVKPAAAASSGVYSASSSAAIWPCASAMLDLIGLNNTCGEGRVQTFRYVGITGRIGVASCRRTECKTSCHGLYRDDDVHPGWGQMCAGTGMTLSRQLNIHAA